MQSLGRAESECHSVTRLRDEWPPAVGAAVHCKESVLVAWLLLVKVNRSERNSTGARAPLLFRVDSLCQRALTEPRGTRRPPAISLRRSTSHCEAKGSFCRLSRITRVSARRSSRSVQFSSYRRGQRSNEPHRSGTAVYSTRAGGFPCSRILLQLRRSGPRILAGSYIQRISDLSTLETSSAIPTQSGYTNKHVRTLRSLLTYCD